MSNLLKNIYKKINMYLIQNNQDFLLGNKNKKFVNSLGNLELLTLFKKLNFYYDVVLNDQINTMKLPPLIQDFFLTINELKIKNSCIISYEIAIKEYNASYSTDLINEDAFFINIGYNHGSMIFTANNNDGIWEDDGELNDNVYNNPTHKNIYVFILLCIGECYKLDLQSEFNQKI